MTNVVAKQSVLFGIGIITNQAFLTTIFINTFVEPDMFFIVQVYTSCAQAFELSVNVLILWLVLRNNYNKYICLCKCCHIGMAKCCFKNIESNKVVRNPYLELWDIMSSNDQGIGSYSN